MTPEEKARQQIDLLLQQCGRIIQDRSQANLAAGPGVAIREAVLEAGEADYLLIGRQGHCNGGGQARRLYPHRR